MDPADEPVLRYLWRSIPRGWRIVGGLALLGLAAWGLSGPVDAWRRARLREEIRAYLAALPPVPPEPAVADDDNAAPLLLKAMVSVNLGSSRTDVYGLSLSGGKSLDAEVAPLIEKNAGAVRFLEAALAKPGFAVGPPPGAPLGFTDVWNLHLLLRARAVVAFRAGRVGEAVADALLSPRMARRIGFGRAPPWNGVAACGDSGVLEVLEAAVADQRLDEAAALSILRDLPSGEEARAAAVADFDATSIRDLGSRLVEFLAEDAELKARARGWRPPTVHERLLVAIGKRKLPPGVEPFPTVGQFREMWEPSVRHRASVGLRGPAAVRRFGPVPLDLSNDIYIVDRAAAFASALRTEMGIEARLEMIRAAAALRLFEMRNGRAPASLAELGPALLPAGTRDPYTEGPLVFRPDVDGWEVTSAGPGAEWAAAFEKPPVIRWRRPAPVPQDGGK